jgi:phage portal protein BeeE
VRFPIREDEAPILHLTLFHPADDHYGLSPIQAAATALDIHNAAGARNKAPLDNAARPSGALVVGGATLTDAQFDRLKDELETNYQGAARCCSKAGSTGGSCQLKTQGVCIWEPVWL